MSRRETSRRSDELQVRVDRLDKMVFGLIDQCQRRNTLLVVKERRVRQLEKAQQSSSIMSQTIQENSIATV